MRSCRAGTVIFRHGFQRLHSLPVQGAKICGASLDVSAADGVDQFIKAEDVACLKENARPASIRLGLNNIVALLAQVDHLRDHVGRMLPIAVQGNDDITG